MNREGERRIDGSGSRRSRPTITRRITRGEDAALARDTSDEETRVDRSIDRRLETVGSDCPWNGQLIYRRLSTPGPTRARCDRDSEFLRTRVVKLCGKVAVLTSFSLFRKRETLARRIGVGHGRRCLFSVAPLASLGVGLSPVRASRRSTRLIGGVRRTEESGETLTREGGRAVYVSRFFSLSLCLFFSRACDYARLRRTVGDRDEGWVVCRDGIAGAPLIYPFTHPCRRPGSCKGAPTLLARARSGGAPLLVLSCPPPFLDSLPTLTPSSFSITLSLSSYYTATSFLCRLSRSLLPRG